MIQAHFILGHKLSNCDQLTADAPLRSPFERGHVLLDLFVYPRMSGRLKDAYYLLITEFDTAISNFLGYRHAMFSVLCYFPRYSSQMWSQLVAPAHQEACPELEQMVLGRSDRHVQTQPLHEWLPEQNKSIHLFSNFFFCGRSDSPRVTTPVQRYRICRDERY